MTNLNEQENLQATDYYTVNQFAQLNPAFTQGCLRALIFNARFNGFDKVIRRIGGRVLIKLSAFNQWVEQTGKE